MKSILVVLLLAGATPAQTYFTRHYDEVVPLTLDSTRIAVLRPDGALPTALAPAMADHDIRPAALRDLPLGGGALVTLPSGRSPADLVRAVASDGTGIFAAPVFLDPTGGPIIPTPSILLRFEAGVDVEEQRSVLDALSAASGATSVVQPRSGPMVRLGTYDHASWSAWSLSQ